MHRTSAIGTGGVGRGRRFCVSRAACMQRRQAAATFAKLDDRLLRDIGLTRADAIDAAAGRICRQG